MLRWFVLAAAVPLLAHDMWMEPTAYTMAPGQIVGMRLRVGQNLLGDPLPRSLALINEFLVDDGVEKRSLIGRDGSDPAGFARISNAGLQVIGYYSKPSSVELPAQKFNEYLSEEGLDQIAALRAIRKQTGADVRELFSRCAKSLVSAGPSAVADRILGFPLELVAGRSPSALMAGESLPLQLFYEKRPLSGALVIAMNRLDPSRKVSARTDRNGRVQLKLAAGGMWMIKAVHMIQSAPGKGADFESFWASLTFEIQPQAAVSRK